MQRPISIVLATAILAGPVAGTAYYFSLNSSASAPACASLTPHSPDGNLRATQPRVPPGALLAITDWIQKPFRYIDETLREWARIAKAVLAGVEVATVVFVVGVTLVAVGLITASVNAVAVLALVAGIAAGAIVYALSGKPNGKQDGDKPPPPPPPPLPLPLDVFLRVRWEPDEQKPDQAKQLVVLLDWRSQTEAHGEKTDAVTGNDTQEWQRNLENRLNTIKDDLSAEELKKNRVLLLIRPYPGGGTLDSVEDLLRKVFGKQVVIEKRPPEQVEAKGPKTN